MITPDGYLFSREAILENLLAQKKIIKRKTAAWEAQQAETQQQARAARVWHDFWPQYVLSGRVCTSVA